MNAFSRMSEHFKKFNEKQFDLEDFQMIARRQRINLASYPMNAQIKGYYCSERKRIYRKKFIVFNEKISKNEKLYVAFHELAHHFLHSQANNYSTFYCKLARLNDSKADLEADRVALLMICPLPKFLELFQTPFDEITEFSSEILIRRQRIFETYEL